MRADAATALRALPACFFMRTRIASSARAAYRAAQRQYLYFCTIKASKAKYRDADATRAAAPSPHARAAAAGAPPTCEPRGAKKILQKKALDRHRHTLALMAAEDGMRTNIHTKLYSMRTHIYQMAAEDGLQLSGARSSAYVSIRQRMP